MSRYIDADKFIKRLNASPAFPNMGTDGYFLLGVAENLLKSFPTADVVEVVHAYWETVTELKDNTVCGSDVNISYQRCSNCKYPMGVTDNIYCGHCGARMDRERKETK